MRKNDTYYFQSKYPFLVEHESMIRGLLRVFVIWPSGMRSRKNVEVERRTIGEVASDKPLAMYISVTAG
jgi:hypothetical protein